MRLSRAHFAATTNTPGSSSFPPPIHELQLVSANHMLELEAEGGAITGIGCSWDRKTIRCCLVEAESCLGLTWVPAVSYLFQVVARLLMGPWLFAHSGPATRLHVHSIASAHLVLAQIPPASPHYASPTCEPHGAGQIAAFNSGPSTSWLSGQGPLASPVCLSFPLLQNGGSNGWQIFVRITIAVLATVLALHEYQLERW